MKVCEYFRGIEDTEKGKNLKLQVLQFLTINSQNISYPEFMEELSTTEHFTNEEKQFAFYLLGYYRYKLCA